MKTKNKIILMIISLISVTFIIITVDLIYNFRDYGIKSINQKANAVAKTVEHALTAQMVSGVIQDRKLFLSQLEDTPSIDKIWLIRGEKIKELYGEGSVYEQEKDKIDKEVIQTGKAKHIIDDSFFSNSVYRITIPYKATSTGKINCISCHTNAKEGDTLGAISIEMSIDDSKEAGIRTVSTTLIVALIFLIIITIFLNYIISPFLTLFDSIKKVMNKAQQGDYSKRIKKTSTKEAEEVAHWINGLLEKLEVTLDAIDSKISIFLTEHGKDTEKDHLINVKNTVDRLSDVYKFRKTIEYDETINEIYGRLAQVLKLRLGIKEFNFFEVNRFTNKSMLVHSEHKVICNILEEPCRSNKTNSLINSNQFENICPSCKENDKNYICIPYAISNELNLIISIYPQTNKEALAIREMTPYIRDYVDSAKTVIMSKKLMNILEENAQTDALTGLKNRKYFGDIVEKVNAQTKRSGILYGVLMLDIDYFKKVNDTYGHDVGDKAIKIVAQTIEENIRKADIAIRFGGEEFIVLLYNCDENSIINVAEKLRINFSQKKIPTTGVEFIQKTMSIGACIYPKDSQDLEECVKYADLALYEAKNTGRNKVVKFTKELL